MSQTSTRTLPGPYVRRETFDYDRHLVAAAASGRWDRLYRALLPGCLEPALDRPGRHVTDPVTGLPGRLAFLRDYRNDGMSVVEPCMYRAGFSTLMYLLGCSFREAVNMAGRVLMPCGAGEEVLSSSPGRRRMRGVVTGIGSQGGIFTVTVSSEPSGRAETVRGRFLQPAFAERDIIAGERIELACLAVETVRTASGRTYIRPRWQVTRLPSKAEEEKLARAGALRDAAIRRRTAALWAGSLPFNARDPRQLPLVRYFRSRGILADTPGLYEEIRFAPRLAHFDEEGRRSSWPAMVAAVRDAGGRLVTVHRTWITEDGLKAPVGSPKQSARLPAGETISGCAVRAGSPSGIIGLAEGIETALSCALACGIPVWPCISAAGLRSVVIPRQARCAVIFADHDRSGTGQKAAADCLARLEASGTRTFAAMPGGDIPPGVKGVDWNDVWRTSGRSGFPAGLLELCRSCGEITGS